MTDFLRLDINIWSISLLGILIYSAWNRLDHRNLSNRLLILFLCFVGFQNGFEILGWFFEGKPGSLNLWMNRLGNVFLFVGNPIPVTIWLLYAISLFSENIKYFKFWRNIALIVLIINAVMSVLSISTGWFFYVSPSNQYHRGPLLWLHIGIILIAIIISISQIIIYRRHLQKQVWILLIAYYFLPILGTYFQIRFYGLNLIWPMTAISVLFVYQNIIDNHLTTDYLTGSVNRRHFEKIISRKIVNNRFDRKLALIAADIDHFKMINDQFGHATGDLALQSVVDVLQKCLRSEDTIARVGGDEFYIVMHLVHPIELNETINRFQSAIDRFNYTGNHPFKLQISFGGVIFDQNRHTTAEVFLAHADQHMYENKIRRHSLSLDSVKF